MNRFYVKSTLVIRKLESLSQMSLNSNPDKFHAPSAHVPDLDKESIHVGAAGENGEKKFRKVFHSPLVVEVNSGFVGSRCRLCRLLECAWLELYVRVRVRGNCLKKDPERGATRASQRL